VLLAGTLKRQSPCMNIYIREVSGKGRGVFAARSFRKGELVEAAPVIVITDEDVDLIDKTTLSDYYYKWGASCFALVLGHGSLYNYSAMPNLTFKPDFKHNVMLYHAGKAIPEDQELTINYLCDLWFEPVD
jgi:SET domain-containing protein